MSINKKYTLSEAQLLLIRSKAWDAINLLDECVRCCPNVDRMMEGIELAGKRVGRIMKAIDAITAPADETEED